jgi:hypothetical protein
MISNCPNFEADAKKNKRIHIFAIKWQKAVETMPNTKHEIFGNMMFILPPFASDKGREKSRPYSSFLVEGSMVLGI